MVLQAKTSINSNIAKLAVNWEENGNTRARTVSFKGDFGFSINGQNYSVRNGEIYDSNNNLVQILKLSKREAYQFVGMSNTAELVKDYTYSAKDIYEAEVNCGRLIDLDQGFNHGIEKTTSSIGSGAGSLISATCDGQKYTTEYGDRRVKRGLFSINETYENRSSVSVWLSK